MHSVYEGDDVETIRRFRSLAVRGGLLLSAAAGAVGYVISPELGQGLLGGGITGVLAFWLLARQTERLAGAPREKAHAAAYAWTALRLMLYGAVLAGAYRLDPESLHGLLGATLGLFIIQGVVLALSLTWPGLKTRGKEQDPPR